MGLKAQEADIPNLRVEFGEITFERELARSSVLLPFLVESFRRLRPTLGRALRTTLDSLQTEDEKADAFLAEFLRSETSKGEFAQELADLLDDALETQQKANGPFCWIFSQAEAEELSADVLPKYIRDALEFLRVIYLSNSDEPNGTA
jgi:hypothetical protein